MSGRMHILAEGTGGMMDHGGGAGSIALATRHLLVSSAGPNGCCVAGTRLLLLLLDE